MMVKQLLILSVLILIITAGAWSQSIKVPIFVFDNALPSDSITLFFGYDASASPGIDPLLGEYELPPAPFGFDARWINPDLGGGSPLDYRTYPYHWDMDTFSIVISNADAQDADFGLMWDMRPFNFFDSIIVKVPAGSDADGNLIPARKIDMRAADSILVPHAQSLGITKFTIMALVVYMDVKDYMDERLPTKNGLSYCYPNPFNSSTTIRYSLPQATYVHLTVFDVLGRGVSNLVDKYEQAGEKRVTFSAGYLPSGVYFYRLQAGSFTETKKFILIR